MTSINYHLDLLFKKFAISDSMKIEHSVKLVDFVLNLKIIERDPVMWSDHNFNLEYF